jgi:hypothetical protein
MYYLSSHLSLGGEIGLKGAGKFDISDQVSDSNEDNPGISNELDSGGIQLAVFIGYHF